MTRSSHSLRAVVFWPAHWLVLSYLACSPLAADAQTIDLSLDLIYTDSNPNLGGTWNLVAKSSHRGIQTLVVNLERVNAVTFEAPTGSGAGVPVAGFHETFNDGSTPFVLDFGDHFGLTFGQIQVASPGPQGLFYEVGVPGGATQPGLNGTPPIAGFNAGNNVPWNFTDTLGDILDDGTINQSGFFEGGVFLASGTFDAQSDPDFFADEESAGIIFVGLGTSTDPPNPGNIVLATIDTQIRDNTALSATNCDFNFDTDCDIADINLMYAQGDLVLGVPVGVSNLFDLNADRMINNADLSEFLAEAAAENGFASPYLRGDTDDIGRTTRDVDITDFNTLAQNFDPLGNNGASNTWDAANFDGDSDIDITDFNAVARNFAPISYGTGPVAVIPEPTTLVLTTLAAAGALFLCRRDSV